MENQKTGHRRPARLREVRVHLSILVAVIWLLALADWLHPGPLLRFSGKVKGTDFIEFYTLGQEALSGRFTADWREYHQIQVAAVPPSANTIYPAPIYGPQIAALFAPLARLPYLWALAVWLSVSAVAYAAATGILRRRLAPDLPATIVWLAAAGFPPFWMVITHGQLSVLALGAFTAMLAWLLGGRRFLAGVALGLAVYKPTLLAPAVACLFIAREWRIVCGAIVGGVTEIALGVFLAGTSSLPAYLQILANLPAQTEVLTVQPYMMHSLRAFWWLICPWPSLVTWLYALSAGAVLCLGARSWRYDSSPLRRCSMLALVAVLVSPHVYHYDLVILVPTFLWLATRFAGDPWAGTLLTGAFIAPFFGPLVQLVRVQPSTVFYVAIFVRYFVLKRVPESEHERSVMTRGLPGSSEGGATLTRAEPGARLPERA